jgi:hypothetical protein
MMGRFWHEPTAPGDSLEFRRSAPISMQPTPPSLPPVRRSTPGWHLKVQYAMLIALLLFIVPVAVSVAMHAPAQQPWHAASRAATGLAPDPDKVNEAVVQVYAARAFAWRGAFAVHTWIIVKRTGAPGFTRYDVVGWGGPPVVKKNYLAADAQWFGSMPELLVEHRGEGVDAMIDRIEAAVAGYPHVNEYRTWPGPNSNTFTAWVARSVPELGVDLPPTAIGKDYLPLASAFARAPSGTGGQVSLLGVLGVTVGLDEGVEVNVLGLSLGLDVTRPALRLPGVGRVGMAND